MYWERYIEINKYFYFLKLSESIWLNKLLLSERVIHIINSQLIYLGKAFLVEFSEIERNDTIIWVTNPFVSQMVLILCFQQIEGHKLSADESSTDRQ